MITNKTLTAAINVVNSASLLRETTNKSKLALNAVITSDRINSVVEKHSLSAPVVESISAISDISMAIESLPNHEELNIVPMHKSDSRYVEALESLGANRNLHTQTLVDTNVAMGSALKSLTSSLHNLATEMGETISLARSTIENKCSDVTEEEIEMLVGMTLPSEKYNEVFHALELYFDSVDKFDTQEYRSDTDAMARDIEILSSIVSDLGSTMGVTFDENGVVISQKSEDYIPKNDMLEVNGINKATIVFNLDRLGSLCETIASRTTSESGIADSFAKESLDTPTLVNSDEVYGYGCDDHVPMVNSYANLLAAAATTFVDHCSNVMNLVDIVEDYVDGNMADI